MKRIRRDALLADGGQKNVDRPELMLFLAIVDRWSEIVGCQWVKHCYPARVQQGELLIAVENGGYALEVYHQKENFLKKIWILFPEGQVVQKIRVIQRSVDA